MPTCITSGAHTSPDTDTMNHLPTDLYKGVAFLEYVRLDPRTSRLICKVVPAGGVAGGGEGGGEG